MGEDDKAAGDLKKRAEQLRECARDARSVAKQLGPYLDSPVKKASPRVNPFTGAGDDAIWAGPYADASTRSLQEKQHKLQRMAASLMADAKRWEQQATHLDDEAKAKGKDGGN